MLRGFLFASLTFHVLVLWLLGYCGRADVVDPLPPETVFQLYTESPLSPEAGRVEPKPLTSSWKVTSLYPNEQVRANSLSDSNHLLAIPQEKQLVRRRLLPNTSSGEVATKQDSEADPAVRTGDLLSVPANPPVSTIDQGALGAPRPDDLHKPIAQGIDATALTEKKPNGSSVSSQPAVDILPKRIYQPAKVYPAQAQRNNWSGEIEVMVEIKNDGKVGEVRILKSSGYNALDEEAVREAKKCRYTPALKDGKPVVYQESFTIAFNLEG